jgi:hypothetical protein
MIIFVIILSNMDPTIPNIEPSIFDNISETVNPNSADKLPGFQLNALQDVESRESNVSPSTGGPPVHDDSDDARSQVATIVQMSSDDQVVKDVSGSPPASTTHVSDEDDSITDSVFVRKVEEVISNTNGDPEYRSNGIARVQAEFILEKFKHQIRSNTEKGN